MFSWLHFPYRVAGAGERLRVWRRRDNTVRTIPAYAAKCTLLRAWVAAILPAMPVELAIFGDAWDKINMYHCPGGHGSSNGAAYSLFSCGGKKRRRGFKRPWL